MIVREYATLPHLKREDGVQMTDFFGREVPAGAGVSMGYGVFPPGCKAPPAIHDADEYAFVLSGSVKSLIGGRVIEVRAGSASFIPAGEEHVSFNDGGEDCHVVWLLVEKPKV